MPRVTISEPGKTPQPYRFKLERELIKIGRGGENDIIIECGSASTNHCVIQRMEGGYILRDKGSTNGIKLDDTQMNIIDLFDGMEVLVGDVPLKFQLSDEEQDKLGEENFVSQEKKKLPNLEEEAQPKRRPSTSSPRASHTPRPQPVVQQPSGGAGKTLLVFVLMIVAIFAGMYIRHSKETGQSLIDTLAGKNKPAEEAPTKEGAKEGEGSAPSEGTAPTE
ncbi:MAG: FHA domain-containing protein [Akkermansiaceae bacterium]